MEKDKIIKPISKGYDYNYASLSDIASQGNEIPKMKTDIDAITSYEYVYYFDKELNEWIRGARVVIPENIVNKMGKNKMNSAQLYGSALTYARRYTTLMALSLVCDDDKELETKNDNASERQIELLRKLYSAEEISKIVDHYKVLTISDLSKDVVSQYISARQNKNNGKE